MLRPVDGRVGRRAVVCALPRARARPWKLSFVVFTAPTALSRTATGGGHGPDLIHGRTFGLIVEENARGGAVEVVILARPETPEKAAEPDETEDKARRNKEGERAHACFTRNQLGRPREPREAPARSWRRSGRSGYRALAAATAAARPSELRGQQAPPTGDICLLGRGEYNRGAAARGINPQGRTRVRRGWSEWRGRRARWRGREAGR